MWLMLTGGIDGTRSVYNLVFIGQLLSPLTHCIVMMKGSTGVLLISGLHISLTIGRGLIQQALQLSVSKNALNYIETKVSFSYRSVARQSC